ncbi:hypothetical protein M378DRAFT_171246 [Amanita muscaria Koide BX008]|uniref:Uncharacterized protein n=1 Tax=Amanita muscaria (strain Koide BX008) TaxID=946122 RepID=A0A0C2WMB6_AMAMK|nr:hypothetical protein M378DRAFT_171246 [Amanita muscaria Koide BX008]
MILNSQPFFVAAILQAFLYTLYLVSLAHVLRRLLYEEEGWILRSRDKIRWGLLTITLVVFIFTTMDLAFEIAILLTFTDNKELNNQIIIASFSRLQSNAQPWLSQTLSWYDKAKNSNSLDLENLTQPRSLTDHSLLVSTPEVMARHLPSSGFMAGKHHMHD